MVKTLSFEPGQFLESALHRAAETAGLGPDFVPMLRPADPRHGDFQANGALPYSKKLGKNPRELASRLLEILKADTGFADSGIEVAIAGPGFLNFTLPATWLSAWLTQFGQEEAIRAGAATLGSGRRHVIDFSSPNTAKQMHVGHLRSTVIGEALSRLLAFTGDKVIRDNHLGDWGTQFGILIWAIQDRQVDLDQACDDPLAMLEDLYRQGQNAFKAEEEVKAACRAELVKLQNGDPENLRLWERIRAISWQAFEDIYERLDIRFDKVLGESFYRDRLETVYADLISSGLATESEGALVVFHPEHKRFATQPFIVRKADGASNYATTDIATILYRTAELEADSCLYVVDARQSDHFEQLFLTLEKLYAARGQTAPELRHVSFGTVLGEGGKPIKTRDGGTVKLKDLLDEAVQRARRIVDEKNASLSEAERAEIAQVVGLGAVKYADLAQNRTSDYIFAWDKMLALEGNTAPYLLYAVARIHSIFRKVDLDPARTQNPEGSFETAEELALARKIVAFPTVLRQVRGDLRPHVLCQYLFELSGTFSTFYSANRVLTEETTTQTRRLFLCARTLLVLKTGLHILGLRTLERM
jgi:arginyl-tRNA synthetase